MIGVNEEKCTGCGLCLKSCPESKAITIENKIAVIDPDHCILCGVCVSACPEKAITIKRKAQTKDNSAFKDLWVFAEQGTDGKLKPVVFELISKGRELTAQLKEKLCVVLIGNKVNHLVEELADYGVEVVYIVDNSLCGPYSTDAFTTVLSILISRYKPNILLLGATHVGRDLAPSVAANLGLGLTADCTDLSINEDGLLLQTRPAFGGNVMADIICPDTRPQMATVRPNVMGATGLAKPSDIRVVKEEITINKKSIRTEILASLTDSKVESIDLEEARIIIAGGRGLLKDNYYLLEELAESLSGVVGCSRPLVEKGLMPKSRQVGQSGKTVSPDLYIACGISGAIQHLVGITNARFIIAINKDPEAPIFSLADIGIVGDVNLILPKVWESIKESRK